MELQGYFTKKGLALAAKLAAGGTLKITRVCAGAAETAPTASALSQIRQTLAAGTPFCRESTAVLPVTLAAGLAEEAYTLRELGVYAEDPEKGEVLYKLYRLSEPVEISPASRLVLRFYLEETLSQDVNASVTLSPAGLATEADLAPLRNKVEAVSVPSRTVEVEAAGLQGYIAGLPRLLAENLTVKVKGGTVPNSVKIDSFYGPGSLTVMAKENQTVTVPTSISVSNCGVLIAVKGFAFQGPSPSGSFFSCSASRAQVSDCSFDGSGRPGGGAAIGVQYGTLYAEVCDFHKNHIAISSQYGGMVVADGCTGCGNTYGAYVKNGGMILLNGTPDLVGGTANAKWGGMIFKGNGTLL